MSHAQNQLLFFLETQNQLSHKTCKLQISGKV